MKSGTLNTMNWPVIESNDESNVIINGKKLINFTSNDYLGLSQSEILKEDMVKAIQRYGTGSTGSRRLSGNHRLFLDAEQTVADWVGKPSAVLFNSGYQMNTSIFSVLASKSTLIIADKYIHASFIDGINVSSGQLVRFRHNDTAHLAQLLKKYAHQFSDILIVCESVYSMDGDEAPINQIIELKNRYKAKLMVDEAHSIGLFGSSGNGWLNHHGKLSEVEFLLVPFGKAFGLSGAMLLSNKQTTALIKAKCRGYIYTTAFPFAIAEGIKTATKLIQAADDLRRKLNQNVRTFKSCCDTKSETQIQPIIIGDNQQATTMENSLIESGYFVRAVHHPTVPKGQSRLRVTLTANHTLSQLADFAKRVHHLLQPTATLS